MSMCKICGLNRMTSQAGTCNDCAVGQVMVEVPNVHDRIVQENTGAICDLTGAITRLLLTLDEMNQDQTGPVEPMVGTPERRAWQQEKNQKLRDAVEAVSGPGKDKTKASLTKAEEARLQFFVFDQRRKLQSIASQYMATRALIEEFLTARGLL